MQENCKDSQRNIQGDAGCVRELQELQRYYKGMQGVQGDTGCEREV